MVKAVFNWSGGKDSALALTRALECGEYEIVALLITVNRESGLSSMHNIPQKVLMRQAESIGIPLYTVGLTPKGDMADYAEAMREAVLHFKEQGVSYRISYSATYTSTMYANTGKGSCHHTASLS